MARRYGRPRLAVSLNGTELPIRDVGCHGEYWRQSGLTTDAAESTQMTPLRKSGTRFCCDAQRSLML